MRKTIFSCLAISLLLATSLWAAENQPVQTQNPSSSGLEYGYRGDMGPGMMGPPGSGYHGRGPGMMGSDYHMGRWGMHGYGHMGRGMHGYGHRMAPDLQGWQHMSPDQREQWRQTRSQFIQDTLPLRQELSAKQMELEVVWDQKNPDPKKIKVLTDQIAELRSKLDEKYDNYLTQCRQEFGDRGWACPGGGRWGY